MEHSFLGPVALSNSLVAFPPPCLSVFLFFSPFPFSFRNMREGIILLLHLLLLLLLPLHSLIERRGKAFVDTDKERVGEIEAN